MDAVRRAQMAVNVLVTMDEDNPNRHRWTLLRDRALEDMETYDKAIEEYHTVQEEKRMIKGV
jgi:hypothetical protein